MRKTMKRISALFTALMMTVLLFPSFMTGVHVHAADNKWDGSVAAGFASGSGTKADPYVIETPSQLAYMAQEVNAGTGNYALRNAFFKLASDIDLGGREWTPISTTGTTTDHKFSGTFIGGGHTISNFKVTGTNGTYTAGLFGDLCGGNYSDFTIANATIRSSAGHAGALGGTIANDALVCNVHVKDSSVEGKAGVGGLVGEAIHASYTSAIRRCTIENTKVEAKDNSAGGILGRYSQSGGTMNIDGCANLSGTITANYGGAGGIVGASGKTPSITYSCANHLNLSNCFNAANIKWNTYSENAPYGAGGIVGYTYGTNGKYSYLLNTGSIAIPSGRTKKISYGSGILGYNMGGTLSVAMNSGEITGGKSNSQISPIDGYGHKAANSYYLASTYTGNCPSNGQALDSMEAFINQTNVMMASQSDFWKIEQGSLPTLYRCCEGPDANCTCGCYCTWHEPQQPVDPDQPENPDHKHVDADNDGYCDDCGACLHPKDENGNCTVEGCTHPDDCCPGHGAENPDKPNPDEPGKKHNKPGMNKSVDKATANSGEVLAYTLISNVPDYLYEYINLSTGEIRPYNITIHDAMDARLEMQDDLQVSVAGKVLDEDLYTLSMHPEDGCTFHIDMDLTEIYQEGGWFSYADLIDSPEIKVVYTAKIPESLHHGVLINDAHVSFEEEESETSSAITDVYGITMVKKDTATNEVLAGAEFTLYTSEDCAEDSRVASCITKEDGLIQFGGLKEGTYYLKETAAPDGYVRMSGTVEIELRDLRLSDNLYEGDFANTKVPETGGKGTMLFAAAGSLILAAALMILATDKREEKN